MAAISIIYDVKVIRARPWNLLVESRLDFSHPAPLTFEFLLRTGAHCVPGRIFNKLTWPDRFRTRVAGKQTLRRLFTKKNEHTSDKVLGRERRTKSSSVSQRPSFYIYKRFANSAGKAEPSRERSFTSLSLSLYSRALVAFFSAALFQQIGK